MTRFKLLSLIAAISVCIGLANPQAQGIFDAVKANDLAQVKDMIGKDAALVDTKDANGRTPLHIAAANGSVAMAELLIEKGAGLGKKDLLGNTPLHAAVDGDQKNMVELLIAKGAEIDGFNGDRHTPFMLAARNTGNVEIGRMLLRSGADLNTKDGFDYKPLNWSAFFGHREFIDFLLDNKAAFDLTGAKGMEILRKAAQCGAARLFQAIAEKGDNLLADENANNLTMYTAISGGSLDIVKMLMARDIPIKHFRDIKGWRPIHQAALNGHSAMIEFLMKNGADINVRTPSGKSAYNIAGEAGRKDTKELIGKLGGDPSPQQFPELHGPYLGQSAPGQNPSVFAPDIVVANHSGITISPDGHEVFWQSPEQTIWTTKLENGLWTKPEAVPFSHKIKGLFVDDVPFLSPDGRKMFFTSRRPVDSASAEKENIWFAERNSSGWSDPKPLGPEVNAMMLHWQVSVSRSGTLYFSGEGPDGHGEMDLYCSRLIDGRYAKPQNLGPVINGETNDGYPFVAPDESYLIYGQGNAWEFSISFRGKDGNWLPPAKLPPAFRGFCPMVSPDGKYFFYASNGILWAEAKFIDDLRPVLGVADRS